MNFKDTELLFGRQMNYRCGDNIRICGVRCGAFQERRENSLGLNPEENPHL